MLQKIDPAVPGRGLAVVEAPETAERLPVQLAGVLPELPASLRETLFALAGDPLPPGTDDRQRSQWAARRADRKSVV